MRLGRPVLRPASALVVVLAPTLAGCGLFDRGSSVEEAFEYVPADTYQVRFADREAWAERISTDDLDPRDLSESDVEDYLGAALEHSDDAVSFTELSPHLRAMRDAPFNDVDVQWEIQATWGDPDEPGGGSAFVWKVGDDVDFDALAEDLVDKGYDDQGDGDLAIYSTDVSEASETGKHGGVYPLVMSNVLLDEDEQIVAGSISSPEPLRDVADVITDDADSLADDGRMNDLLDAADGDPELALMTTGGEAGCALGGRLDERQRAIYDDLGRPEARALLVYGEDPEVLLALQYDSDDAAEDDVAAREDLVQDGVDPITAQPFAELGDFDLERAGDLVLIAEDFAGGAASAVQAEQSGGGPGACTRGSTD
ncbi:hypothetical protein [Nocardioides antri]|uniref:DUF3352 domain-containing protein n=1 Tax=Nocardioides antri TaxID=2607659 RepID=A0A5B1M2P6_9ACTN|nr:hypothetical protein [Nocardioides antri]KAA1426030.1 hypothetical protein F0U47_16990 [Nocardioides antri]